jgi:CheY-like chemotaxis protein
VPGSQPSGFGIGLAVVKEIVTLYGGSIKVKSILTKGTSFLVKIPCNAVMISGSKLKVLASSKPGITCSVQDVSDVVIVEDNSNLRELLHEVLAANHFAVSSFISAPEALAHIVSSTSTRCVLIDINMPLLNGAKFHELLKASQRDINVAFMSGYSKESATKILGFCPENFLAKPFTNAALIDMIRKLTLRGSP